MTDIEVRLRTSEDTDARRLTAIPFGVDPSEVIRLIGRWGVVTPYGEFDEEALSGQFVVDDTGAFFEVIVDVDLNG